MTLFNVLLSSRALLKPCSLSAEELASYLMEETKPVRMASLSHSDRPIKVKS
jgi:hypothetical protein